MPLPRDVQQLKPFQFQGGALPPDPHQGLCPWAPLGALPSDLRYKLALRARHGLKPSKLEILATYLLNTPPHPKRVATLPREIYMLKKTAMLKE